MKAIAIPKKKERSNRRTFAALAVRLSAFALLRKTDFGMALVLKSGCRIEFFCSRSIANLAGSVSQFLRQHFVKATRTERRLKEFC
jgi:hypothetical protein